MMKSEELILQLLQKLNKTEDALLIGMLNQKLKIERNYSLKFTKSEKSNAKTGLAKTLQSELINIGILKKDKRYKDSTNLSPPLDRKSKALKPKLVDEIINSDTYNNLVECKILINKIQSKLHIHKHKFRYDAS